MKKIFKRPSVLLLIVAILLAAFSIYSMHIAKNTDGPTIEFGSDSLTVKVGVTDEELLKDVTASDHQDKDVTDSLVVEGLSTFMDDNTRMVTYAAFDSDNNVSKATRKIRYEDYTSPRFSLTEPLSFPVGTSKDILEHMTAVDIVDGDISGSILMYPDTNMDTSIPGDYKVRFEVANSAGDVEEIEQTVHIFDTMDSGELGVALSNYIVYVDKQAKPADADDEDSDKKSDSDKDKKDDKSKDKDKDKDKKDADDEDDDDEDAEDNKPKTNVIAGESDLQDLVKGILHGTSVTKIDKAGNAKVSIDSSNVDWSKPGVYTVVYSVTANKETGKTKLTVVVRGEGK